MVRDVSQEEFEQLVVERSRKVPVVVDFWAEWCGPCRQLGPALEAAVAKREGRVELAKVDVDSNQAIAQAFAVKGIPAVKAFRDGEVVAEFTGAIPPQRIDEFLGELVPSPADELAAAGDESSLRLALEADPHHAESAAKLGRILVSRGDEDEARELLSRFQGDFLADGLLARLRLAGGESSDGLDPAALQRAFAAWDAGDHEEALEALQTAITSTADTATRDLLRRAMVGIFAELGPSDPLARAHRRRLASALS
ncbi:MAG: tetratricopeptide repeat protein [Solirubrobacterales bacterium]